MPWATAFAADWRIITGTMQTEKKLATNLEILKRIRNIIDANEKLVMSSSELRKKTEIKTGLWRIWCFKKSLNNKEKDFYEKEI